MNTTDAKRRAVRKAMRKAFRADPADWRKNSLKAATQLGMALAARPDIGDKVSKALKSADRDLHRAFQKAYEAASVDFSLMYRAANSRFKRWLKTIDDHMQDHGMGYEDAVPSRDGDEAIEKVWDDLFKRGASPMSAVEKVFGPDYS